MIKKILILSCFHFVLMITFSTSAFAYKVVHRDSPGHSTKIESISLPRPLTNPVFNLGNPIPLSGYTQRDLPPIELEHLYAAIQGEPISDSATDGSSSSDAEEEEEDMEEEEYEDDFADEFEVVEVYDPLSGYNRWMTNANVGLYDWVLIPIAKGWEWAIPECIRRGFVRMINNVLYPVRLVNNLLQGKLKNSGEETLRFTINTTVGLLGFFDPAKSWFDLEAHPEDFGQTLGYWGVGAGPHVVLPFLGPSNLRDSFSLIPDYIADPTIAPMVQFESLENANTSWALWGFDKLNYWSINYKLYESIKRDALDLYPHFRDFYESKRQKEIEE